MFIRYTVPLKFLGKNHQTALCIEKGEIVMICFCNLSFCSCIYISEIEKGLRCKEEW